MRLGILQTSSTRKDKPPQNLLRLIRDIDPHLIFGRTTRLSFSTTWSWDKNTLITPLREIFGFANDFYRFRSITVSCRVPLSHIDVPSYEELAERFYGEEGVYSVIVSELAVIFDVAAWNVITERSGIWPGYCLLPNCTDQMTGGDGACEHQVPTLAYRVLNVQVYLIPLLGTSGPVLI